MRFILSALIFAAAIVSNGGLINVNAGVASEDAEQAAVPEGDYNE